MKVSNKTIGCVLLVLIIVVGGGIIIGKARKTEMLPVNDVLSKKLQTVWKYLVMSPQYSTGPYFPASLTNIEEGRLDPKSFVCDDASNQTWRIRDVEVWGDFIYIGNYLKFAAPKTALLISPAENHQGKYGYVLFAGGQVVRVAPSMARSLVFEPWLLDDSLKDYEIDEIRGRMTVRVPERHIGRYGSRKEG